MTNYIPYTVKTTVVYGGRAIDAASFSNSLFVSHHNLYTDLYRAYSSVDGMLADGFATGSPAIKYATGVFAGKQAPSLIYIGRATPSEYNVLVDSSWIEGDVVTANMKLNGVATTFSYTVLENDTQQLVGDGLAALIEADAGITSATADAQGLITIVPVSTTVPLSFGAGEFTTVYTATTDTPEDTLASIRQQFDNFTTLCAESHNPVDQEAYSIYAEANDIMYVYTTNDEDVGKTSVTDDIFSVIKGLQPQYTLGAFSVNADVEFPEGAIIGSFLAQDPSYNFTMNLQDLVGITPSKLSDTEKGSIVDKNGNYYELDYGVGAFKEGFVGNGDFIDRSRFGLWLKLRSQESMFTTMKSFSDRSSALAYSDAGIEIVKSNLYTDVINVATANGSVLEGFSKDSTGKVINLNPIVTTSTRAAQTNNAIGTRLWEGFEIEVVYTGSIHHINSKGYVINNRTVA